MMSEEENLFDDFLRKSLDNYQAEPSPGNWNKILAKLPNRRAVPFFLRKENGWLLGMITGLVVVTSILVYQWNGKQQDASTRRDTTGSLAAQNIRPPETNHQVQPAASLLGPGAPAPVKRNLARAQTGTLAITNLVSPILAHDPAPVATENATPVQTLALSPDDRAPLEPAPTADGMITPVPEPAADFIALADNLSGTAKLDPLHTLVADKNYYFHLQPQAMRIATDPDRLTSGVRRFAPLPDYYQPGARLSVGLAFHPEWLTTETQSRYGKNRQTAALLLRWQKNALRFETGLGLMKESMVNTHEITYNKLIGVYNKLLYITFDPLGIPNYYYSVDSIFDTRQRTENQNTTSNYTFLQIPFLAGVVEKYGRSSFSVNTGPVLSLQLSRQDNTIVLSPDQKLVHATTSMPARLVNSWQWYLGVSYEYAFTDKFSFFLEPALRTYLDEPYTNNQQKRPVFWGLRSGFLFQIQKPFQ